MRLLFDAHLDLSWNALSFDRDQKLPVAEIRQSEEGRPGKGRGCNTVSLAEMRRGGVGLCLATMLSRCRPDVKHVETPPRTNIDYANQDCAFAVAMGQLAYYNLLEEQGHMRMIRNRATLQEMFQQWKLGTSSAPIGYILSMEGADPIVEPAQAEFWWKQGLRTLCLAHYSKSAYSMGTGGDGPLTPRAYELLKEMDRLGVILDLVHTADTAVQQALDNYRGPVFVSHGNCRALVPGDRQMTDEQIKTIAARGGVVGVVLDAWMLKPTWRSDSTTGDVSLETLANHIDHIAQISGSVDHVAIGSDLDGGFGTEQTPGDLDTIADLQNVAPILQKRGYTEADINAIYHGNWMRFFLSALPAHG